MRGRKQRGGQIGVWVERLGDCVFLKKDSSLAHPMGGETAEEAQTAAGNRRASGTSCYSPRREEGGRGMGGGVDCARTVVSERRPLIRHKGAVITCEGSAA